MITDEEKQKIKLEEIFRDEIRKKLSEKERSSFSHKIWKFINSPLGLWLLSTVLVGLVVYFYDNNKLQNQIIANNTATLHKLETEISNRLQQFRVALENQDPSKIYYQKDELAYMIDGTLISDGSLSREKPIYIFPEYKERTMNSLLYEISRLTIDKNQASIISEARSIISKIQASLLNMDDPPRSDYILSQRIQQIAQSQPELLSTDEKKILAQYEVNEVKFQKGPLAEYHIKIKENLDSLLTTLLSNSFLQDMSNP